MVLFLPGSPPFYLLVSDRQPGVVTARILRSESDVRENSPTFLSVYSWTLMATQRFLSQAVTNVPGRCAPCQRMTAKLHGRTYWWARLRIHSLAGRREVPPCARATLIR